MSPSDLVQSFEIFASHFKQYTDAGAKRYRIRHIGPLHQDEPVHQSDQDIVPTPRVGVMIGVRVIIRVAVRV